MADSIFRSLEIEAFRGGISPRTKESAKWFMNKLKGMNNINRTDLLKDPALSKRQRVGVGNLFHFFYDPKHRKTLPYYDGFPLVIIVETTKDGFYGLNLHYLPPKLRAILFDNLLEATNNKRYDETTKFKVSYSMLKSISKMKYFKPCFKRYLTKQIGSKIVLVEPPEWEIATFLPTQQFQKASQSKVWADSRKNS
jgi:hypothetical protein